MYELALCQVRGNLFSGNSILGNLPRTALYMVSCIILVCSFQPFLFYIKISLFFSMKCIHLVLLKEEQQVPLPVEKIGYHSSYQFWHLIF